MFLSPSHIRTLTAAVMLLFSAQTTAAKQESVPEVKIQSQTIQKKTAVRLKQGSPNKNA